MNREFDRAASIAQPLIQDDERWLGMWLRIARDVDPDVASRMLTMVEPRVIELEGGTIVLADVWTALARRSGEPAHYSRAEHFYRQLLDERPDQPVALNNLAAVLLAISGRSEEAAELASRALDQEPDNTDFIDTYANALADIGRFDHAVSEARRAVELKPDDPGLQCTLVRVLIDASRLDEAEAALTQLRAMNIVDAEILQKRERLERRLRDARRSED
jgi:Flp pilus assembly protein TadD